MLSKELNALADRFQPHVNAGTELSPESVAVLIAKLRTMARDAARTEGAVAISHIGGPVSGAMRRTAEQLLILAGNGGVAVMQLQLACGAMLEWAEQVERLENMAVPASQRADNTDIASGKVLLFCERKAGEGGG